MNRAFTLMLLLTAVLFTANKASAQVTLSGSIQSDILVPQDDEKIGTEKYDDWKNDAYGMFGRSNTYVDLNLGSKYVDAGVRFEYLKHPLPGYDNDIKGMGFPHLYIKGHYKNVELTAGDFYDQFGSGFVLRTYEERSLGVQDSLVKGTFSSYSSRSSKSK